jgi:hypothetical protein
MTQMNADNNGKLEMPKKGKNGDGHGGQRPVGRA